MRGRSDGDGHGLTAWRRFDAFGAARLQQPGLELLAEAVAVPFDVDGDGVVEQAIEDRGRDHGIAEHLAPGAETLIAGEDDGPALVAARDELEEKVGPLAVNGDVADLVDDEDLGLGQELQAFVPAILRQGLAEGGDLPRGRGEQRAVAVLTCFEPERDGQMGLADAGRTEQEDIVAPLDVAQRAMPTTSAAT